MSVKVYTKPSLVQIPLECAKWPRVAKVAVARPEVAWTEVVSEKTMLSKSVAIRTNIDKVWELIGDPNKIPVFDEGVIEIDWVDDNTFKVKDVYRIGDGPWETQVFTEKVLKKEAPRLIQYEIEREGHKELFTFTLEGDAKKDTTILTLRFDANFALANPRDVEILLEKIGVNVARLAIDEATFRKVVKEFKPREKPKQSVSPEQAVVG